MRGTLAIYTVAFGPGHQLTQDVGTQLAVLEAGLADRAYDEQQQQQQAHLGRVRGEEGAERGGEDGEGADAGHGYERGSELRAEFDFEDDPAAAPAYHTKPGDETRASPLGAGGTTYHNTRPLEDPVYTL